MQTIKAIIADDHEIFREGLKTVLKKTNGSLRIELAGEADSGEKLIHLLRHQPADLLIFDLNLPGKDGLEVLRFIHNSRLEIRALVLTMYDSPKIIRSAFKAGADGYVLKSRGTESLFSGIREVMSGNNFISEGLRAGSGTFNAKNGRQNRYLANDRFLKKHSLTKREVEILHLITQALSNKEIAKTLFISDQTVSVHRKNIMRKLGVSNTAGLVKVAYDNSLV